MAYIYKITNQINGKVYIGKTLYTIEKRWKEHISDSRKDRCEKRPLYDAINKYGIENFIIEQIDECNPEDATNAEVYWINKYRSYIGFDDCNGYNATLGGDSKHYCDYDWVMELWTLGLNNKQIQEKTGYDRGTIAKILENNGITSKERQQRGTITTIKKVGAFNKETDTLIKIFNKVKDVDEWLGIPGANKHIGSVCRGKRKSAYGYKWKYIDE